MKIEEYRTADGIVIYRLEEKGMHQLCVIKTPFESEWTPKEFSVFIEVNGRRFMSRNDGVQEIVPMRFVQPDKSYSKVNKLDPVNNPVNNTNNFFQE